MLFRDFSYLFSPNPFAFQEANSDWSTYVSSTSLWSCFGCKYQHFVGPSLMLAHRGYYFGSFLVHINHFYVSFVISGNQPFLFSFAFSLLSSIFVIDGIAWHHPLLGHCKHPDWDFIFVRLCKFWQCQYRDPDCSGVILTLFLTFIFD